MIFKTELLDIIDYAYSQAHDSNICVCPSAVPEWDDRNLTDEMYNRQLSKLQGIRLFVEYGFECIPKFDAKALKILSEEIERRIEDWCDVMKQVYGDNVPDNDEHFDSINERIHLLLMLLANLDTVGLIKEYGLSAE